MMFLSLIYLTNKKLVLFSKVSIKLYEGQENGLILKQKLDKVKTRLRLKVNIILFIQNFSKIKFI